MNKDNCMEEAAKFTRLLNEDEDYGDDGKKRFGIKDDGWDKDDLYGLIEWTANVAKLAYEINNGRRGSYAQFGDTLEDLVSHLGTLKDDIESIASDYENKLHEEEDSEDQN